MQSCVLRPPLRTVLQLAWDLKAATGVEYTYQVGLNAKDGGMGLRHSTDIAAPAFLGSVVDTADLVAKMVGEPDVAVSGVAEASSLVLNNISQEDSTAWTQSCNA